MANIDSIPDLTPIAWPLVFLLLALVILWRVEAQINPIVVAMTRGVANNAAARATEYVKAMMFGLSASLAAFYDLFSQLDTASFTHMSIHQYLALWAKVANPFVVAVLAYATQSGVAPRPSNTQPPFPPAT